MPSKDYFNTPQFTLSAWFMPKNISLPYARILDFSNGCHNNSIGILLDQGSLPVYPKFEMFDIKGTQYQIASSLPLTEDLWQHIALTYDGVQVRFYLNAILLGTSVNISYEMPLVNRTKNFIGGTSCPYNGVSSSYVDDVRIYGKELSQSQINDVMMSSASSITSNL